MARLIRVLVLGTALGMSMAHAADAPETGRVLPFKVIGAFRNSFFKNGMVQAAVTVSVAEGLPADWVATAIYVAEHSIVKNVTFATVQLVVDNPWGDRPPTSYKMLASADYAPDPNKGPQGKPWLIIYTNHPATQAEIAYGELTERLDATSTIKDPEKRLQRDERDAARMVRHRYNLPANWKPNLLTGAQLTGTREQFTVNADGVSEAGVAEPMKQVGRCLADDTSIDTAPFTGFAVPGVWRGCMRKSNSEYPDPLGMKW